MRIDASGNVGIGTSSPSAALHVVDSSGDAFIKIEATENLSSSDSILRMTTTNTSASAKIQMGDTGDVDTGQIEYDNQDNSMRFQTNAAEAMRIDSSGSLLVGTTTSYADSYHTIARSIQDDSGDAVLNVVNLDNTATSFNTVLAVTQNDVVFSGVKAISFRSVGGTIASITMSNAAVAYNTSSDYRLKENIEPIQNGLERLNQLNPVKFDWKEDGTSSEGFIAHEVQEIFSDAIAGEKDGEDMQGMDYGRITPLLVKAIQEQQTIIESLEARITALES
jgi:hypothetical protein